MAVEFQPDGGVGYITLNKPPANSYDHAFISELGEAVNAAAGDDQVAAVIVNSSSEKFFSAGADVKAFQDNHCEQNMDMVRHAHEVLAHISEIPKVFICEIAGHALGGGLEIALACDLRFGSDGNYKLGVPEATLGLLPGNGGTQRLPRLIGKAQALDLLLTGRTIAPSEAKALGLLNAVYPTEELSAKTRAYADNLANGARRALGQIKSCVNRGLELDLADGLRLERESIEPLFRSRDGQEGIGAFLEKRQPQFIGA
jgi:enoyl-CoA hydratase/carnithine racemase